MKKSINIVLTSVLLTLLSWNVYSNHAPNSNLISDPSVFQWTFHPADANNPEEYYSGVIEVGEATFSINGETLTTRAYRQEGSSYSIPGPTIHMEPGNKYILQFKNTLPYETLSTAVNVFKDPNASNIHTHGLHISGESPGDDVTRTFEGQQGGDFVYDIPEDHMGGTYWYHAHHHGSTMLQVSGGLFGLIVINDMYDGLPANVAAMEEKQFVIAYLDPGVAGTGGDTLISGSLGPTWTVNGKVNGNYVMPPDTWQHWRVLLADRDAKPKNVVVGSQCEVALMARDGVWRTVVPKNLSSSGSDTSISLTGASRADLAVRCASDSTIKVGSTTVANIYVDGQSDPSVHPYASDGVSTWSAIRPTYLRDLRTSTPSNTETVRLGARTINGSKFDHHVPNFTLAANGVQEWSLSGAQNHPFHLHIYHVQVIGNCGEYEDGEYYDVVAGNCTIRFDLNPATSSVYSGRTVMHCHILQHEDQGAMGWADVQGGLAPPTFPANTSFQEYYTLGTVIEPPVAPASLTATAISSNQIDVNWSDLSLNEDGFTLERSTDGINFSFQTQLGANTTSYSDTGLTADTLYYYRIFAWNSGGNSDLSNIANATTNPAVDPSAVQPGSILLSTVGIGKGNKIGRATITVIDDQGSPVADAVVSGEFTGTFNESIPGSAPTSSDGSTSIDTSGSAKGSINLTFCVTNISHPVLQDFSASSGEVCGSL